MLSGFNEETEMAVVPRDAATVILLRDGSPRPGIETLMVRRHARSGFAADMHVFPGGALEGSDCEAGVEELCGGMSAQAALSVICDAPSPALALGVFVAGIRETFEETGILLARDASGALVSHGGEMARRLAVYREDIEEKRLTFNGMIAREGLELAVDLLTYFAHWITPDISPIRFDTRFFLAPAPPGQEALHDNIETIDHIWIAPDKALERSKRGDFAMLPPTAVNLLALSRFTSVEEALTSAEGKEVPVIAPRITIEEGKARLLLPDDEG